MWASLARLIACLCLPAWVGQSRKLHLDHALEQDKGGGERDRNGVIDGGTLRTLHFLSAFSLCRFVEHSSRPCVYACMVHY